MDEMAGLELQETQMFHNSARFLLIVPMTVVDSDKNLKKIRLTLSKLYIFNIEDL